MGIGKGNKGKDLIGLLIGLVILFLANYVMSFIHQRFDLTSEKRFTLSTASTDLISGLEDYIFVKVYLEGDLDAPYKKLRDATQETLDELRIYSPELLQYEFINPSESSEEKVRNQVYQSLSDKGLQYSNPRSKKGGKYSEQIIFPGAIISYRGREIAVQLLKSQMGTPLEVMVNNSIQQLEYELSSNIRKLVKNNKQTVAFIQGHGELDGLDVADITKELDENYNVETRILDGKLTSLKDVDCIIIAKPDSSFAEKDKFVIDQFIMKGGKVLWFIDNVHASIDSLMKKSISMAIPKDLNLDDMLFKYGARITTNLVMDRMCLPISILTGYIGDQPKMELFPWFYDPLIMPPTQNPHPIVKNIDALKTQFVNTIDFVGGKDIQKTVLLTTSQNTKLASTPARVSINILREPPDERQYSKSYLPVAVLLEGEFESVFKNRMPPKIKDNKEIGFADKGIKNSMIVVADGDIIKNPTNRAKSKFFPLGYDKNTRREYGNKSFVLNAINYLCDNTGLIEARSKEFKIRMLDTKKIENERMFWQSLNVVIPVIFILLFGITKYLVRRKKYAKS